MLGDQISEERMIDETIMINDFRTEVASVVTVELSLVQFLQLIPPVHKWTVDVFSHDNLEMFGNIWVQIVRDVPMRHNFHCTKWNDETKREYEQVQ